MNDVTKRKPIDEIRAAFHLIHRVATGQSDRGYMSIPPNPARDADLIVDAAIDELESARVHLDGEPERLARAREEQRAACVRIAEAFQRGQYGSLTPEQRRIGLVDSLRTASLTATPLADEMEKLRMRLVACSVVANANTPEAAAQQRQMHPGYRSGACEDVAVAVDREMALRARVAELEAEVSRRDALIRADGYEDMRQHAQGLATELASAHERLDEFGMGRDGSKATVAEGIAAMRDRIGELRALAESKTRAGAEARVKELEAHVANLLECNALVGQDCLKRADAAEARAEKADARVKELERSWRLAINLSEAMKLALDQPGTGNYVDFARECRAAWARVKELEGAVKCDRYITDLGPTTHVWTCNKESHNLVVVVAAERDALKAQLDEAVSALRALVSAESSHLARGEDTTPGDFERAWKTACAVLAKHPEGK